MLLDLNRQFPGEAFGNRKFLLFGHDDTGGTKNLVEVSFNGRVDGILKTVTIGTVN